MHMAGHVDRCKEYCDSRSIRDLDEVKFQSRHCVHIGSMEFQIPRSSATDSSHASNCYEAPMCVFPQNVGIGLSVEI